MYIYVFTQGRTGEGRGLSQLISFVVIIDFPKLAKNRYFSDRHLRRLYSNMTTTVWQLLSTSSFLEMQLKYSCYTQLIVASTVGSAAITAFLAGIPTERLGRKITILSARDKHNWIGHSKKIAFNRGTRLLRMGGEGSTSRRKKNFSNEKKC